MAASITYSGRSVGSINEGASASWIDSVSLRSVWEAIQAAYPTAARTRTSFGFSLIPESGSQANFSDFTFGTGTSLIISLDSSLDGSVTTFNDTQDEPNEQFSLQFRFVELRIVDASGNILALLKSDDEVTALFAPSGGLTLNLGKITGSIIDNDLPPNTPPTAVNFVNTTTALDENSDTTSRIKVADITITDDGLGTNNLSLSGTDAASFEIIGTTLYLKANTTLDFETKPSYSVTVAVNDPTVGTNPDATKNFTLSLNNINEAPTAINFSNTTTALDENSDTTSPIKVADISITDDGQGTNNLSLSGTDAANFEIIGNTLYLKANTILDYETRPSYSVTVNADDTSVGSTPDASNTFTLQVNDLVENTAPTDLSLSPTTVNENVAVGTTVGSFSTTDAEGGSFTYALVSGTGSTDNASFIIDGNQLKINTSPDFETQSSYSIRVKTTDASGLAYEEAFTIGINDLPENRTPTAVNDSVKAYRRVPTTIAASTLLANDTDPDAGTTLRITGVSNATNGTVSLNSSGNVVFTATNTGNASFQYTISDGSLTSTATVAVSVGLSLNGGNGIDFLHGSDRDDLINGNGGADALYGNKGKDIITGGHGNDLLLGGEGDDLLDGGDSADILYGGRGNDILTGGSGKDIFAFISGDGSDIITDFADGSDKIGLVGLRFSQLTISASGSNTAILSGTTTLATLTGVSSNLITAADFVTL